MLVPRIPQNEAERIQVLRDLLILDTEPEERFDVITAYCQSRFEVEIALVSLVDTDRQWFKSTCGLDAKETPRDISFCGHAILQDEVFIVKNAMEDPRFADNPLVAEVSEKIGADIDLMWQIEDRQGKTITGRSTLRETTDSEDYMALVAAQRRALSQVAIEMAEQIRRLTTRSK